MDDNNDTKHIATFAAGCFWGVEERFRTTLGVIETTVGYMGGHTENPTYKEVCTDETGHAEVVQVAFDPTKISYKQLLEIFWDIHDPTQVNRQGPDTGTQYRSAIFVHSDEQRDVARQSKDGLEASGAHAEPIATEITEASVFTKAEEYHQQYLLKQGKNVCH